MHRPAQSHRRRALALCAPTGTSAAGLRHFVAERKPKRAKQIRDVRVFAANSRHLRSCCVRRAQRRERQGRVRPRPLRFSNPPSSRRPCWRGDPQSGQRPLRLSGDVHASLFSLIASRYAGQPISSRALATSQKRISAMARKSEQERWSGFLTGDAYWSHIWQIYGRPTPQRT